jgi:predicted GIY-YIG superfamily endonuclease
MNDEERGRRTAVYRFYAADGELLYVGLTFDAAARFRTHKQQVLAWHEVSRIELTWYETRADAQIAESAAIRAEDPRWNRTCSPTYEPYSKWRPLAEWMREQIESGHWTEGKAFPSLAELARQWEGMSTMVIKRALQDLIAAGLVHRVERMVLVGPPPSTEAAA